MDPNALQAELAAAKAKREAKKAAQAKNPPPATTSAPKPSPSAPAPIKTAGAPMTLMEEMAKKRQEKEERSPPISTVDPTPVSQIKSNQNESTNKNNNTPDASEVPISIANPISTAPKPATQAPKPATTAPVWKTQAAPVPAPTPAAAIVVVEEAPPVPVPTLTLAPVEEPTVEDRFARYSTMRNKGVPNVNCLILQPFLYTVTNNNLI